MQSVKRAFATIAGNIINAIVTLGRVKLLALFLAPVGVGYVTTIGALVEVVSSICGQGLAGALNRELPRAPGPSAERDLISGAVMLSLVALLIFTPIAFVLLARFGGVATIGIGDFIIFAIILFFSTGWRLFAGMHFGYGIAANLAKVMIGSAVAGLVATTCLLIGGIRDPVVIALIPPFTLFAAGAISLCRRFLANVDPVAMRALRARSTLLRIAAPIVFTSSIQPGLYYYIRLATGERFGATEVGLLQPGIQLVVMSALVVSSAAGMTLVRWDQSREVAFSRKAIILLACSLAAVIGGGLASFALYPLFDLLIRLLFTPEFLPALPTISYFLLGESFRVGGFLLNQTFISRGHNRWTLWSFGSALVVTISAIEMMGFDGSIVEISQAYALGFMAFFLVSLVQWIGLQSRLLRDQCRGASQAR